jgi:hypothetical protein
LDGEGSTEMISLLIPFDSDDPERIRVFDWVLTRWSLLFDGWEIVVGGGGMDPFSRSAARNEAFDMSTGDILVVSDADTICESQTVIKALRALDQGAPWVVAHDRYYSLTREYTNRLLSQSPSTPLMHPFESDWIMHACSLAGVLVIPRAAWERVGGYNEEFIGWGFEDNEFAARLDQHWGRHVRGRGPMLHLWHPRGDADFSQPHIEHNKALYENTIRKS